MTWYDTLFLGFVVLYGVVGYFSGIVKSATGVVGIIFASWVAGISYSNLALSLMKSHESFSQEMAKTQAYATAWIGTYIAFVVVSTIIINAFRTEGYPKASSRWSGAVFGILKAVFILALLMILIFEYTPQEISFIREHIETKSVSYPVIKPFMEPVKAIVYSLMSSQWTTDLQLPPDMLENVEKRLKEKLQ